MVRVPQFHKISSFTPARFPFDEVSGTVVDLDETGASIRYYLVSQAHAGNHTVVTHEVPSASTRMIKIPDACIGLGIKCMTPFEMLRLERARFVLGPEP